jgi:hypothetical protein
MDTARCRFLVGLAYQIQRLFCRLLLSWLLPLSVMLDYYPDL